VPVLALVGMEISESGPASAANVAQGHATCMHACIHYPTKRPGGQIICLRVKTEYGLSNLNLFLETGIIQNLRTERFNITKK
jgi:hypothetical protein